MSLKDFFSKKEKNVNPKSTKIGGKKSDDLLSKSINDVFGEDDFKKSEMSDENLKSLVGNSETKDNISLQTDISVFTNNFENIDDFENKLNSLSSNKLNVEDGFDLAPNILGSEVGKSSLGEGLSERLVDKKNDNDPDERLLMELYENDAKQNQVSSTKESSLPSLTLDEDESGLEATFLGGALADELNKQPIQENLESINPELESPIERTTLSDELADLELPVRKDDDEISLVSLSQLDEALDVQTLTHDDMMETISAPKDNSVRRKKYNSIKKEQYKKSIFGNLSAKNQYIMFSTMLVVGVVGLGGSLFFSYDSNNKEASASKITASIGGESQQFRSVFREYLTGVAGSHKKMTETWNTIINLNVELRNSVIGLQNPKINELFNKITKNVEDISKNVQYVKELESTIKDVSAKKAIIDEKVSELVSLTDKASLVYVQNGGNQSEVSQINFIKSSLKNINASANSILVGETVNQASIADLNSTIVLIQKSLIELADGSPEKGINKVSDAALPVYSKLVSNWNILSEELSIVLKNADILNNAKSVVKSNNATLNSLNADVKLLSEMYDGKAHGLAPVFKNVLIVSLLLLIISLGGLGYVYRFESEKKKGELKAESDRNKKSVNKLLNEMVYLQTGNLTKKTTVEEGITLDIADSINATIDSLVVVVTKIKNSSLVMKQKTNEINLVSTKLLDATEKQSDSIVGANESINNIARAINKISEKTKESLITAQNSAEASNLGACQVRESIESMNAISNNMEETVVLMKKVSDSSKQISEVISLLSDITEETNILAFNATVQAAKAGEAGKGFKVVADSIQELADNAAEATRRVGALIATVQTDIHSVGSSIERTNKEVERGVELSENAGQSLNEITEISNKLAEIVKSISSDANTNADAARQISHNMSAILKVTEETKKSTKKTTNSITEIDKMSSELSESVKTFIVP